MIKTSVVLVIGSVSALLLMETGSFSPDTVRQVSALAAGGIVMPLAFALMVLVPWLRMRWGSYGVYPYGLVCIDRICWWKYIEGFGFELDPRSQNQCLILVLAKCPPVRVPLPEVDRVDRLIEILVGKDIPQVEPAVWQGLEASVVRPPDHLDLRLLLLQVAVGSLLGWLTAYFPWGRDACLWLLVVYPALGPGLWIGLTRYGRSLFHWTHKPMLSMLTITNFLGWISFLAACMLTRLLYP